MTNEQFDAALRAFLRRRPFVKFFVEFASGEKLSIAHPEALDKTATMYVLRSPNDAYSVFPAESVTRLHD
ncbi:MAG TPA: hypothetical protein VHR72_04430 [Gemmataceae bacterium]|jgi:hypothetical protein|nr:hypothetical protein [Gemmataceae bacterium]